MNKENILKENTTGLKSKVFSKEELVELHENWYIPQMLSQFSSDEISPNPLAINPNYCRSYCCGFDLCKRMIESRYILIEKDEYDDLYD